jgi:predicted ArsR family transcriptional regulator
VLQTGAPVIIGAPFYLSILQAPRIGLAQKTSRPYNKSAFTFFGEIMTQAREPLEIFWDAILSRQPDQIRSAYALLPAAERRKLIAHLQRMVSEEGWHPEQRKSARVALDILSGDTEIS